MRVMVIVKSNAGHEAGALPSAELLEAMGRYNDELIRAGVMLAGEGLHPSSKGLRMRFDGQERTVIPGPFAGPKTLAAGFWLWRVDSLEDAAAWLKRAPFEGGEVEIRQIFENDDFGDALKPEERWKEEHRRAILKEWPQS